MSRHDLPRDLTLSRAQNAAFTRAVRNGERSADDPEVLATAEDLRIAKLVSRDNKDTFMPLSMLLYAPKDKDAAAVADTAEALANSIHTLVEAQTDRKVASIRALGGLVRINGQRVSHAKIRDAVDELVADGRLIEFTGPKRSTGYEAVVSAP